MSRALAPSVASSAETFSRSRMYCTSLADVAGAGGAVRDASALFGVAVFTGTVAAAGEVTAAAAGGVTVAAGGVTVAGGAGASRRRRDTCAGGVDAGDGGVARPAGSGSGAAEVSSSRGTGDFDSAATLREYRTSAIRNSRPGLFSAARASS